MELSSSVPLVFKDSKERPLEYTRSREKRSSFVLIEYDRSALVERSRDYLSSALIDCSIIRKIQQDYSTDAAALDW
jgi:hypothetical protein